MMIMWKIILLTSTCFCIGCQSTLPSRFFQGKPSNDVERGIIEVESRLAYGMPENVLRELCKKHLHKWTLLEIETTRVAMKFFQSQTLRTAVQSTG